MQSDSSQVLEYLRNLGPEAQFSKASIRAANPDLSHGAISGFLNRLEKEGAICVIRRVRKDDKGRTQNVFQSIDLSGVNIVATKPTQTEKDVGHRRGTTSRDRIVSLLRSIADEIEHMRGSISDFSTNELLKEIGRRTNG